MILDTLVRSGRYIALHPAFARAFDVLANRDLTTLEPGRHEIDRDRIYVSIDHNEGRGREGARLEAHRRYLDIQFTIDGGEEIGWMPLHQCRHPAGPFDLSKDIQFFSDLPRTWVAVPPGHFAIFFPEDAHAPLAGRGFLKKAIVKIASTEVPATGDFRK
ncbi:MAG: YhcH/YjgK/YiaL family protein [Acidobacteria bacterium]|nr:MAG: YhcH/YjgK/YiaL family protein [Acidobacteriota bacterium]